MSASTACSLLPPPPLRLLLLLPLLLPQREAGLAPAREVADLPHALRDRVADDRRNGLRGLLGNVVLGLVLRLVERVGLRRERAVDRRLDERERSLGHPEEVEGLLRIE